MTCIDTCTNGAPYARLAGELRASITAGKYGPGDFIGSEVELSRRHSLARMTVRRAVQKLVDEGLIERRPGKGLYARDTGRETRSVRIMAGNLCWEPAVQMARAAREVAKKSGVELHLSDAHGHIEEDLEAIRRLPLGDSRGAILMSLHCRAFHQALCGLMTAGYPFVVVDQDIRELDAPSVASDNAQGGRLVGEALVAAGHRSVAFLGDLGVSTTHDRLLGLREALLDNGLRLDTGYIRDVQGEDRFGDWTPRVFEVVRDLMKGDSRPTALACSCDAIARSAFHVLSTLNLKVPDDISVTGFDDDPLAQWLTPGLSTVRQPFADIGRLAMELLLEKIVHRDTPPKHHQLAVEYVERGSVASPAAVATSWSFQVPDYQTV